jgi:hypothetical protein
MASKIDPKPQTSSPSQTQEPYYSSVPPPPSLSQAPVASKPASSGDAPYTSQPGPHPGYTNGPVYATPPGPGPQPPPSNYMPNGASNPRPPASSQGPPTVIEQMPGPAAPGSVTTGYNTAMPPLAGSANSTKLDVKSVKSSAELGLREYMSLQRRRYHSDEPGLNERLRIQAETAMADLRLLRKSVAGIVKDAESHRWRRWLIGGAV